MRSILSIENFNGQNYFSHMSGGTSAVMFSISLCLGLLLIVKATVAMNKVDSLCLGQFVSSQISCKDCILSV